MNALNYRNSDSLRIEGEVKLNGNKVDWDKITRYSGYVQQDDLFIGTMTVREHITFIVIITYVWFKIFDKIWNIYIKQAMLNMRSDCTKEERINRVDQVLMDVRI